VQHGDVALGVRRIVGRVSPGVNFVSLWMTLQAEDFDNSIPDGFPLKRFRDWDALQMLGFCVMQMVNHVP
jgi:hypothetical protein